MTQNVYKVVVIDEDTGKYKSVCSLWRKWGRDMDKIALEYKIGKVTKPKIKGSSIYAFDSIENALCFISISIGFQRGCTEIFECEYEESDAPLMTDGFISPKYIRAFWKFIGNMTEKLTYIRTFEYYDKNNIVVTIKTRAAPTGTVMCKWVKPIKVATLCQRSF